MTDKALEAARNRVVRDALAPLAAGVAILQGLLAFGHYLLPGRASSLLAAIDAGSAALFAGFRFALGRRPLPDRWAHPVAFTWGLLLVLIVLVHLRLLADPLETLMLMLVVIGGGSFMLSFPWYGSFAAVSLLGWALLMASLGLPTGSVRSGFALVGSAVVAAIILRVRLRTLQRLETLREQDEGRRQEVEDFNRRLGDALAEVLREQSLHQTIADNFPNGAFALFNKDLKYTLAGGLGLPALGLSRDGLEGKTLRELFPADVSDRLEPAHRATLEGQSSTLDLPVANRIYQVHFVPVRGESGEAYAGLLMTQDVTEARLTAESLRESEETHRLLFEQSPLPMWVADRETLRFLAVNEAAVREYGYSRPELLELTLEDVRSPSPSSGAPPEPADDATGQGIPRPEIHRRKDHSLFDVEVVSHSIAFGEWPALLAIVNDVTERKQMAAERERIIAELKEALASVKTLRGLIPICASCKKIRDDQGYWSQVEVYVRDRSEAQFSHGICPDCRKKIYGR
ncbi:MAG TPA: PAS domain S-box protein [Vicinamibacteria bacterium]|nr:PAS domain S-box protein [Vicinamibacteria bacterium]